MATADKRKRKKEQLAVEGIPDAESLARTRQMAISALAHYGEPQMTLEELHRAIAHLKPGRSLSDALREEREAGW